MIRDVDQYQHLALRTLAPEVRGNLLKSLAEVPMAMVIMNCATGLSSETGEVNELVKKRFFHFHPWTPENQAHMKKELGDIAWYWAVMCFAHGMNPSEVLQANVEKLLARYPDGFSTERSINRASGDI